MGVLDEVRASLPTLELDARQQAGPRGVQTALEEWFSIFPQAERSDPEWVMFYKGYTEVCGMVSRAALRAALAAWAKKGDSQFLPKPGELRALAMSMATTTGRLYARAKAAIEAADDEVKRQRIDADIALRGTTKDEQAEAVRAMLGQFQRESAPGRNRANDLLRHGVRNTHGGPAPPAYTLPPGATLSDAMRATLVRQGYSTEPAREAPDEDAPGTEEAF